MAGQASGPESALQPPVGSAESATTSAAHWRWGPAPELHPEWTWCPEVPSCSRVAASTHASSQSGYVAINKSLRVGAPQSPNMLVEYQRFTGALPAQCPTGYHHAPWCTSSARGSRAVEARACGAAEHLNAACAGCNNWALKGCWRRRCRRFGGALASTPQPADRTAAIQQQGVSRKHRIGTPQLDVKFRYGARTRNADFQPDKQLRFSTTGTKAQRGRKRDGSMPAL